MNEIQNVGKAEKRVIYLYLIIVLISFFLSLITYDKTYFSDILNMEHIYVLIIGLLSIVTFIYAILNDEVYGNKLVVLFNINSNKKILYCNTIHIFYMIVPIVTIPSLYYLVSYNIESNYLLFIITIFSWVVFFLIILFIINVLGFLIFHYRLTLLLARIKNDYKNDIVKTKVKLEVITSIISNSFYEKNHELYDDICNLTIFCLANLDLNDTELKNESAFINDEHSDLRLFMLWKIINERFDSKRINKLMSDIEYREITIDFEGLDFLCFLINNYILIIRNNNIKKYKVIKVKTRTFKFIYDNVDGQLLEFLLEKSENLPIVFYDKNWDENMNYDVTLYYFTKKYVNDKIINNKKRYPTIEHHSIKNDRMLASFIKELVNSEVDLFQYLYFSGIDLHENSLKKIILFEKMVYCIEIYNNNKNNLSNTNDAKYPNELFSNYKKILVNIIYKINRKSAYNNTIDEIIEDITICNSLLKVSYKYYDNFSLVNYKLLSSTSSIYYSRILHFLCYNVMNSINRYITDTFINIETEVNKVKKIFYLVNEILSKEGSYFYYIKNENTGYNIVCKIDNYFISNSSSREYLLNVVIDNVIKLIKPMNFEEKDNKNNYFEEVNSILKDYKYLYNNNRIQDYINKSDNLLKDFDDILSRNMNYSYLQSNYSITKSKLCDEKKYKELIDKLIKKINKSNIQERTISFNGKIIYKITTMFYFKFLLNISDNDFIDKIKMISDKDLVNAYIGSNICNIYLEYGEKYDYSFYYNSLVLEIEVIDNIIFQRNYIKTLYNLNLNNNENEKLQGLTNVIELNIEELLKREYVYIITKFRLNNINTLEIICYNYFKLADIFSLMKIINNDVNCLTILLNLVESIDNFCYASKVSIEHILVFIQIVYDILVTKDNFTFELFGINQSTEGIEISNILLIYLDNLTNKLGCEHCDYSIILSINDFMALKKCINLVINIYEIDNDLVSVNEIHTNLSKIVDKLNISKEYWEEL